MGPKTSKIKDGPLTTLQTSLKIIIPLILNSCLFLTGHPPAEAARIALQRIIVHYPQFEGAVVTVSKDGIVGKF